MVQIRERGDKQGRITKPPTTDNRPLTHQQVFHRPTDNSSTDPSAIVLNHGDYIINK